jgi:hypothetical protein
MSDPHGIIGIYRKGGSIMAESFLENINQMVIDAAVTDISDQLFDDWMNANLDEGTYFSDRRFAEMSGDKFLYDEFNKHYNLTEEDDDYLC